MSLSEISTNTDDVTYLGANQEILVDPNVTVFYLGVEGADSTLVNRGAIGPSDPSSIGLTASLFSNNGLAFTNFGSVEADTMNAIELGTRDDDIAQHDAAYTVQNSGAITSQSFDSTTFGIKVGAGQGENTAVISNAVSGTISAGFTAISSDASALTVINAGYIAGLIGDGVDATGALTLSNTGTIYAAADAIEALGMAVIANHGQIIGNIFIEGDLTGQFLSNDGSIDGTISLSAGKATLNNSGTISGPISFGGGNNTVNNAGHIYGNLVFGGGIGNYDGEGGTITGSVTGSGGVDTFLGGAGKEVFEFGSNALSVTDTVDGGGGNYDRILFITTKPAVAIAAAQFTNVSHIEQIVLANATNSIVIPDALVVSADDNHLLTVTGGTGADTMDATLVTTNGDRVSFQGGNGADMFRFTASGLNGGDTVDGGNDTFIDRLVITTAGTIAATKLAGISHVEQIALANGTNAVTLSDALVSSSDNNHQLAIVGGTGADTINAAAVTTAGNHVRFEGLGGADRLTFSAGNDTSIYDHASDSTGNAQGTAYDTFVKFDAAHDRIDLPAAAIPTTVVTVASGTLNSGAGGTFDTDMSGAIGASLAAHTAVLFHVTAGNLLGHDFLVVNPTGTTGYVSGQDYVFDITGYAGTIAKGDFI